MKIPFHKAYITDDEINEVVDSIRSGWLTMGPKTIEFERKFRDYIYEGSAAPEDQRFAVSLSSATAAMHLALKAVGVKSGDEVILPTNTFIATAEVVTYFNALPVLCDIGEDTHNIDASKIESLITDRTKVIMPVHYGGNPCDMDEIMEIAGRYGLRVVEDAAHALPSTYRNRKIGTIGDITAFSFYATKTLCTGEGGMATTTRKEFAEKMKINRLHGIDRDAWDRYTLKGNWYYEVVDNGNKYNMTDLNAALGLSQLRKVDWMRQRRAEIARRYSEAFAGTDISVPETRNDRETSWHLYAVKVHGRNEIIEKLAAAGIGTSVHFIPVHRHPYYRKAYGYRDEDYPAANRLYDRTLSLPIYPGLTDDEVDFVIENMLKYAR